MSRALSSGADKIQIVDPTGIAIAAPFTFGGWFKPAALTTELIRLGNTGTTLSRGWAFSVRDTGALELRNQSGGFIRLSTAGVTAGAWHRLGVGYTDAFSNALIANGSSGNDGGDVDLAAALQGGDVFSTGQGVSGPGYASFTGEVGWLFYLAGVHLNAAAFDAYLQDPQSLVDDYGPSGAITPNALKLFWPMQCDNATEEDVSGVGNDGAYSGTTLVADEPDPTTAWDPCGGVAGTAAVTGTAASGASSKDLREGGKTFVATLTGDTFIGAFSDTDKLNILNGLVAAVTQTNGWNNQRSNIDHTTAVVRTSANVATITLPALPGLHLDHDDILEWTIPGSVLTGGSPIVATPTVRIAKVEPDPFAKVVFRVAS